MQGAACSVGTTQICAWTQARPAQRWVGSCIRSHCHLGILKLEQAIYDQELENNETKDQEPVETKDECGKFATPLRSPSLQLLGFGSFRS